MDEAFPVVVEFREAIRKVVIRGWNLRRSIKRWSLARNVFL
jgi:hypothetical protein